jgi:hypothetical protein
MLSLGSLHACVQGGLWGCCMHAWQPACLMHALFITKAVLPARALLAPAVHAARTAGSKALDQLPSVDVFRAAAPRRPGRKTRTSGEEAPAAAVSPARGAVTSAPAGGATVAAAAAAARAAAALRPLSEAELARPVAVLLSESDTLTLLDMPGEGPLRRRSPLFAGL